MFNRYLLRKTAAAALPIVEKVTLPKRGRAYDIRREVDNLLAREARSSKARELFDKEMASGKPMKIGIPRTEAQKPQARVAPASAPNLVAKRVRSAAARTGHANRASKALGRKSMAIGAAGMAGLGVAALMAKRYSDQHRVAQKTAAIPAARIAELRKQMAPRIAGKLEAVSGKILNATGADKMRMRAHKNRLGGMLGKAEHHGTRTELRRAGVDTNVRSSAERIKGETDPFGSARSAHTPVKPSPMAGDKTVVSRKPAGPSFDPNKTNPGFKRPSAPSESTVSRVFARRAA